MKQPSESRDLPYDHPSQATIIFHWLVGLGMLGMLLFGLRLWLMTSGPAKTALIPLHKSFGIIVGLLALVRIGLRLYEGFPASLSKIGSTYEKVAARLVQIGLLVATLVLPVSGIAKSVTYARSVSVFGFQIIPQLLAEKRETWHRVASLTHTSAAIVLVVFLAAHICAAMWHHLGRGNTTLLRILGR